MLSSLLMKYYNLLHSICTCNAEWWFSENDGHYSWHWQINCKASLYSIYLHCWNTFWCWLASHNRIAMSANPQSDCIFRILSALTCKHSIKTPHSVMYAGTCTLSKSFSNWFVLVHGIGNLGLWVNEKICLSVFERANIINNIHNFGRKPPVKFVFGREQSISALLYFPAAVAQLPENWLHEGTSLSLI